MRLKPEETLRRLRTAAVMGATAFVLLFLTSPDISRFIRPHLGVFFYIYAFSTVLGILAVSFLFPAILATTGSRPVLTAAILVMIFGVLVSLPYLLVVLLGESGSLFWYLVYGLFIPSGLLISAHLGLMVVSLGQYREGIEPLLLGPAAFIGSCASPIVTLMPYYGYRFAISLGTLAILFLILTLVSDVGLIGWATQRLSRSEADEPDL